MVWWVEWDQIFASITYTKRANRFTNATYTCCTRPVSVRHHQYSFRSRVDLKTFLDSVCHPESEKNSFKVKNIWQNWKFCTFRERMRFFEKWHLSSISYFSSRKEFLLRLKCGYSWSAAKSLSNDVKIKQKNFTGFLRYRHLTWIVIFRIALIHLYGIWSNMMKILFHNEVEEFFVLD